MPRERFGRGASRPGRCGEPPRHWRPVAAAQGTSLIHLSSVAGPSGRLTLSLTSSAVINLVLLGRRQRLPSVFNANMAATAVKSLEHNRADVEVRRCPTTRCGVPGKSRLRQEAERSGPLGRSITTSAPNHPVDSAGMVAHTPDCLGISNLDRRNMRVRARLSLSLPPAQGLPSQPVPSDRLTVELRSGTKAAAAAARIRLSANRAGV